MIDFSALRLSSKTKNNICMFMDEKADKPAVRVRSKIRDWADILLHGVYKQGGEEGGGRGGVQPQPNAKKEMNEVLSLFGSSITPSDAISGD